MTLINTPVRPIIREATGPMGRRRTAAGTLNYADWHLVGGEDHAMRFNPPPNWPPPQEGWVPSPGWTPDSSWPPPPPGWQLWIDDEASGRPPGGRTPRKVVIGLCVAAAVIVGIGVTTIIVAFQRSDPPISDEDQIRETLNSLAEAYNNADHDSYVNYFCPAERSGLSDEAELRQDRAETGRIDFDVVAIEVTGDTAKVTATASVENEDEPDTDTLDFVKQDGRWMVLLFGDECSA